MKLHLLPLLLFFSSCCAMAPEQVTIGEPLIDQPAVAFAVIDARPTDYFDRTVLVEATVTAVCQSKGCWMQIEDQGKTAMVRWESGCGGQYAFPADSVGRRVLVQGSFYPKQISAEDAAHLTAEAAEGVEFELETYEFNASAVVVRDES